MSNKYFDNTTLNDFWDRLVTAVANLGQKALEPGAYTDATFTNLVYTWDELLERGDSTKNGGIYPYQNPPSAELAGYYYVYGQNYAFVIPDTITTGVGTEGCKALVFPSTTTEFQTGMEGTIDTIYIKATTPPTLPWEDYFVDCNYNGSGSNGGYVNIVVPMGCGDAYKTADIWSTYADYITEGEMPGGSSANSWGPVTFDESNMQGYVSLATNYNVLETLDAVEYSIYDKNNSVVKSGYGFYEPDPTYPSYTTPLTDLPNGNYIVRITSSGASGDSSLVGLEGTLTIGTVEGTAEWVHNILMKHAKLTHQTTPVTPADYMKGIAVCARYLNDMSNYLSGTNTLSEIVRFVENIKPTDNSISFTIAQQPIAAQNDVRLTIRGTAGTISKVKISVYDETADVRLVATSDMDVSTASVNIMLSTIYPYFILDNYYRVQVIAYGPNNTSGTKELYITWPYANSNPGGGDTGDWPTPQLEFIDGGLYVSNYTNGIYNCIVDIDYYDSMGNRTDSMTEEVQVEDGYVFGGYYYGSEYCARLAIYNDNGDLTAWSNDVTLG